MRDVKSKVTRPIALAAAALLALTAAGCGGDGEGGAEGGGTITVGSKEFPEQRILGQIAIKALENAGYDVKDQTKIQGTANVRKALTSKQIDLYWEYTGTGWVNNLGHTSADAPKDPKELYTKVAEEDLSKHQIKWLDMSPANNSYAIATKAENAQALSVNTISDYAALANKNPDAASLCAASEFLTRQDGWLGLQKAYGFNLPKDKLSEVELGIIHDSVSKGSPCKFGEVFETDGKVAANNLKVLEDDKSFIVKYNIALNVRKDVFDANPKLAEIFNPISAKLTTEEMRKMNEKFDVDQELEDQIAETWLKDNGFLD